MKRFNFNIEQVIFGSALLPVVRRGGLHLVVRSILNALDPYFYTSHAAQIARTEKVPRRLQWAVAASVGYLFLVSLTIIALFLRYLSPADLHYYLIILPFTLSATFRVVEEIIVPRDNLEKSVDRLVETDGVVHRPSAQEVDTPLQERKGSTMNDTRSFLPISLDDFERHLQQSSDSLEERTQESMQAVEMAFAKSKFADTLEFDKTSSETSKARPK